MQKKYLNLLLITIAFIIWMVIFYQMVLNDNNDQDNFTISAPNSAIVAEKKELTNLEQYISKNSVDPFITPFNYSVPKPKITNQKSQPRAKSIPKLQLLGILTDKDGPMAIVGFPDNTIQFVREKQKIEEFIIKKISMDAIEYIYDGISQTINLQK